MLNTNDGTTDEPITESHARDLIEDMTKDLVEENRRLAERVDALEDENTELRARVDGLEEQEVDTREDVARIDGLTNALANRTGANLERISELQSRELEKAGHLLWSNVDEEQIDVASGKVERITKDDGEQYARVPGSVDDLERGGAVSVAYDDLLPIQQLARWDDTLLGREAMAIEIGAKLWQDRERDSPRFWETGGKGVRQYVDSEAVTTLVMGERDVSKKVAQEYARRVMDEVITLSRNRVARVDKKQRKNGLSYSVRRLVITEDVDLPGESPPTSTTDATGNTDGGR